MDIQKYLDIFRKIDLFDGLSDNELSKLIETFSLYEIKAGEVLFKQGDFADSLYVVITGHLLATLDNSGGERQVMGTIRIGEVVGEMGLLSKKPRFLSVKALTDSQLLRLSEEALWSFTKIVPELLKKILFNTINRTQSAIKMVKNKLKNPRHHFVLFAANPEIDIAAFIESFRADSLNNKEVQKVCLLDVSKLSEIYETKGLAGVLDFLDVVDVEYEYILHIAHPDFETINNIILQRCDKIAVLANGNMAPQYDKAVLQMIQQTNLVNLKNQKVKKELILLWPSETAIEGTIKWLKDNYYDLHYHVRPLASDYRRLLRFWIGRPIGIVLSGGASRGWAHVGALMALTQHNIPVDAIGGTSSGAGAGACYLISENTEDMVRVVQSINSAVHESSDWTSVTIPLISLYDGVAATEMLKQIFKSKAIEDFSIPYFAVGCNISTGKEVVFTKGPAWRVIRSSCAVPGVLPPVVDNGELIVDGGVVNNLPVDHMRNLLGDDAIIIACDLGITAIDNQKYDFPPTLPLRDMLLYETGMINREYVFPKFFATLLKSMLMGSSSRYEQNLALANYCIHPKLDGFKLLDFSKPYQEQLIKLGYESTLSVIKKLSL